jgi:eukaryotic-like serine/threonine-protein kinase
MAMVWAARMRGSRGFQKLVAIKTILAGAVDSTRMEQMFLEEAQLASQIHHPNVVATHDLGEHQGVLYLVMEWVEGEPLNAVLTKAASSGGVPLAIGVNLIGQACQGLHAAHDLRDDNGALLGVVHRDVSPQNILVTYSGTAKLVDFGIAKATSKASGLTEAGEIKGKFAYMAPEQVRGGKLDARTDLFALGILLYAITTGKHPFRGENPAETVQNICAERAPAPPSSFISDYPSALEQVVMKSIAKAPEDRFGSATEMLSALERAMPGPLEASFDARVAEYMKSLFGNRPSERRAALRVAQEHADRQRGESSSSISVGTLRALAIDQSTPGTPVPRTALEALASTQASATGSDLLHINSRKRARLYAAAGAVAVLLSAGVTLLVRSNGDASHEPSAASRGLPAATLEPVSAPPAAPVVSAPSAEAPATSSDAAELEPDAEKGKKRSLHVRGARPIAAAVAAPAAPVSEAAAPKVPSTPPVASTATAVATPAPAPSTNAWDRSAFGGRH